MKMINTILILIIIIFIINHLSNGQILETFKNGFNIFKNKIEKFVGIQNNYQNFIQLNIPKPTDFELINPNNLQNKDGDLYLIYRFINNLVMPNINIYEIINNKSKKISADNNLINQINIEINKIFNSNGFKFSNIQILNPNSISYYQVFRGKYFERFYFSANVSYLNKNIDSLIIGIELFLREDKSSDGKPFKFLSIVNVELGKKINPFTNFEETKSNSNYNNYNHYQQDSEPHLTNAQIEAIATAGSLNEKLNDSFNNLVHIDEQNDLFIKSNQPILNQQINNDDSLIPSNIELSYEPASHTQTS